MELRATKPMNVVVIAAAIAVIVLCAAGVAAIMGWTPNSLGNVLAPPLPTQRIPAPDVLAAAPATSAAQQAPAVQPLPLDDAPPAPFPAPAPVPPMAAAECANCGVVESVRQVKVPRPTSGLGVVGGAVGGGLLGHELVGGPLVTIAGAVGGAVLGDKIEQKVRTSTRFKVTVRMDDGRTRVATQSAMPQWRAGDRVKFVGSRLQADHA